MKVYTYDYQQAVVVEDEADEFGFPHQTASGRQQYENTHFLTWGEARERLLANLRAGLSMQAMETERLRKDAAAAAERVASIAIRMNAAEALSEPTPSTDPAVTTTKGE